MNYIRLIDIIKETCIFSTKQKPPKVINNITYILPL